MPAIPVVSIVYQKQSLLAPGRREVEGDIRVRVLGADLCHASRPDLLHWRHRVVIENDRNNQGSERGHMLTLRQIEVIRAIMVTGSIAGAARLLNVAAPGISRLMKYSEDSPGVRLCDRRSGRYVPTP